jgi:dolichol-phosphate mannosyltransferase
MGMTFGSGVIANRFIDYSLQKHCFLFIGNVNDSSIVDVSLILQEEDDVRNALQDNTDSLFVFFSTCSIQDSSMCHSPYVQHKLRMERLIQSSASKYFIFRLPQILGLSDTTSGLINYLVDAISHKKHFQIWENATKNLIDIDDVHEIVSTLLKRKTHLNKVVNIASTRQISVLDIVLDIERFFNTTANYTLVNKGASFHIDVSEILPILDELNINFDAKYLPTSLGKYFSHYLRAPILLSLIVPTYNEEFGIDEFYRRTKHVMNLLSPRFTHEIIFVNDFSTDKTLQRLQLLAAQDGKVKLVNFSRNFGNQIGITAGMDFSQGEIAVIIDDDLQDPPEVILNLISKWDKGHKVVYGVRPVREGVNPLFKFIAKLYYRVIGKLSETKIPNDTGDFRLIDRVVIDTLKSMKEENRYYRGMVSWVGFSQTGVYYERDKRYAGVSTFSLSKYANFAVNGLTSFTEKPLYFSSLAGIAITSISFILALVLIISKIYDPSISIRGWTSLTVVVLFFGGIQLLSIGILGVYISKIYREVKGRPLYIVESTKNIDIHSK